MITIALAVVATFGAWTLDRSIDRLTDQPKLMAKLAAPGDHEGVGLACSPNSGKPIKVLLLAPRFLGDGRRPLSFRFDGRPAVTRPAEYSRNGAGLDDGAAAQFLEQMGTAKRVLLRLTTFEGESVDLDYAVDGADGLLAQFVTQCPFPHPG